MLVTWVGSESSGVRNLGGWVIDNKIVIDE